MQRRKLKIEELCRISVEEFRDVEKIQLAVILDNVRSRHNIGSVFRTGDAFKISEILLCGMTGTPPDVEIHKTALGAEDSVNWRYFEDTLTAIESLRAEGYTIFSIEQAENSVSLDELLLDKGGKYAVIFGHEVHGVAQTAIDASDGCIEIAQYGTKHSLNVSVTAGIVIWDFFQQLKG